MSNEVVKTESESLLVPARELNVITDEIKYYWLRGQAAVLDCVIEIGRRLVEAKGIIPHGQFGSWVKENFEFSHSSANTYMRLFEEYGADQLTIFGAVANSQTFANLPYSKALQLLAIPKEEREEFAKEVGAESLSTRELEKVIKERNEAVDRRIEAEERAKEYEQKLASAEIAKAKAESAAKDADAVREKVSKLEADLKKKKDSEVKLKEKLREAEQNPKIPEDMLAKLKADAEAEAKAAQDAEIARASGDIIKQLEEAQAALVAAQKEKEQAEAIAKEVADKLLDAQKKLKMASPSVTEFKALFNQVQGTVQKMRALIEVVRGEDAATAEKLTAALKAFGGSL